MLRRALVLFVLSACVCLADGIMAFTVTMPQPASHIYHVMFRCDGLKGELQDFKMPQWSPGYYGIGDYARNVSNFRAEDASGHALAWEKVTKNTWRVVAENAPVIVLNYDVFGNTAFAANTYLGEDRGYISPSGMFVHLAGQLQHPVTVTIRLPANWKQLSTGLEAVKGLAGTFDAPDFDVLYDCPILIGNQEHFEFEVKGVPHHVAIENVAADVDRPKMVADLKTMVTAATQLMGDVPYKHYTFLMMGRGGGGIEHANSSSNQFNGTTLSTPAGYLRWLSFICHEYFHNFNVKRIRPLALGPFDYDQENLTNMLWVSEGLSVYYQDLLLVRAGLMTKEQYLAKMAVAIGTFENGDGRHYQSATESSQNTWNSGSGVAGDRNTTISYYNNGAMLGAMLDLQIREGSGNRKSLDDVMHGLYRKFYREKKRGFTDAEFRAECESAAGVSLAEIFEYAATTKEVNYAKYFALAGLQLDVTAEEVAGGYLGVDTHTDKGLVVVDVAADSPAAAAGLKPGDRILQVDGTAAAAPVLNKAIQAGSRIQLHVSRAGSEIDVEAAPAHKAKKTYRLSPVGAPAPAQQAILSDWLRRPE
ncbi:MAG TPA: PDZ domain-containing protein [Candidatus Sulfopaludibacter sp.]|jgi:predicted metalloprotease with PDZ domain|nr:PDZ domain-containing protein [Candidatus Sulfopaludibacter sp.]